MDIKRIAVALLVPAAVIFASGASAAAAKPAPIARQTFTGQGDDVVKIRSTAQRGIVIATHSGESNFALWAVKASGANSELLVNTIGDYSGTVVFDTYSWHRTGGFKIEADGRWRFRVAPISYAPLWKYLTVRSSGDKVLKLAKPVTGLRTIRYKHSGSGNFVVQAFPADGNPDLLVNKIGSVSGKVILPAGTRYVAVEADGKWYLVRK